MSGNLVDRPVSLRSHLLLVGCPCAKGETPSCTFYSLWGSGQLHPVFQVSCHFILANVWFALSRLSLFSSSLSCRSACSKSAQTSVLVQSVPVPADAAMFWMCGTHLQWWIVGLWVLYLWQWSPQLYAPAQVESSPTSPAAHIPKILASMVVFVWTLSMATGELKKMPYPEHFITIKFCCQLQMWY